MCHYFGVLVHINYIAGGIIVHKSTLQLPYTCLHFFDWLENCRKIHWLRLFEYKLLAGPPRLLRPPRPGPCLNFGFQYAFIRNNRSKKFGVEYWALPGSNSPWWPCLCKDLQSFYEKSNIFCLSQSPIATTSKKKVNLPAKQYTWLMACRH